MPLVVLSIALISLSVFAASSGEEGARGDLRDAERLSSEQLAGQKAAADRAARAAATAVRLAREREQVTAKLQQAESRTADVATRIDHLAEQRRDAEKRLEARSRVLQPLMPLIERLSFYPAETMLAVPTSPDTALRGILVLRGLARQVEIEAEALRRNEMEVDVAAEALQQEAPRLIAAETAQKREADALDQHIAAARAEQGSAKSEAEQAAERASAAASRMKTLRAALTALAAQRRSDEERSGGNTEPNRTSETHEGRKAFAARSFGAGTIALGAEPHGQLQPPVIGIVVKGWGDRTDAGPATGVFYNAPPSARVFSPCGGRAVFATNFRSYGLLLIIDCGGGYHVVLAGFERLDMKSGQSVVAGESVGVMPSWEPGSDLPRPTLYVELRRGGQPVNPAPWFRSSS